MNATLEHTWHEFAGKLGQFIRSRVSDPATAEDVMQDAFVKIQQRLGQLQDPAKLQSWIYLIQPPKDWEVLFCFLFNRPST